MLYPVGGVGRQPAPRGDVDLGPVVDPPGGRLGFPSTLPAGRDAGDAAEGDEDGVLDAAVAAPGGEPLENEGRDGAVFVFGDADFYGSIASVLLNRPVVGGATQS